MTQAETQPGGHSEPPTEPDPAAEGAAAGPQPSEVPAPELDAAREGATAELDERRSTDAAAYRVQLPAFEGPLDLLLHLIQQHELDILDIPISFITEKYLAYIRLMQDLNIDVASDYLVMAAQLAHIKSRELVPSAPEDEDDGADDIDEDPRGELVRRLLEYQKYKNAASQLGDRSVLGRDVFLRGISAPASEGPSPIAPVGVFRLLEAFQGVLSRAKANLDHEIGVERFSIADRIQQLSTLLESRTSVLFEELFEGDRDRGELVLTFLALLEMTRLRMIQLDQGEPYDPIRIALSMSHADSAEDADSAQDAEDAPDQAQDDDASNAATSLTEPDSPQPESLDETRQMDDERNQHDE